MSKDKDEKKKSTEPEELGKEEMQQNEYYHY